METQNFEKKLAEMDKPEIPQLKHEDMLAQALINARDKSVVSWWWLSIPVFIIMMLLMKSVYMPGSSLISNLHELAFQEKYLAIIFFLISPIVLIIINALSIRKIYFLSGNPKSAGFLQIVWLNILIIAASVFVLIIYSI